MESTPGHACGVDDTARPWSFLPATHPAWGGDECLSSGFPILFPARSTSNKHGWVISAKHRSHLQTLVVSTGSTGSRLGLTGYTGYATITGEKGLQGSLPMAFDKFTRTRIRSREPVLGVKPDGSFVLNAIAVAKFAEEDVTSVWILWDASDCRVALRAAPENDETAYKISFSRTDHTARIAARAFCKYIGWNAQRLLKAPAEWNDKQKQLEASLPSGCIGSLDGQIPSGKARQKRKVSRRE